MDEAVRGLAIRRELEQAARIRDSLNPRWAVESERMTAIALALRPDHEAAGRIGDMLRSPIAAGLRAALERPMVSEAIRRELASTLQNPLRLTGSESQVRLSIAADEMRRFAQHGEWLRELAATVRPFIGATQATQSLRSLSALTAISARLVESARLPTAAFLPPTLRNAPVVESYLSARALVLTQPEWDTSLVRTYDERVTAPIDDVEAELVARGWLDIAKKIRGAYNRVLDSPAAPDRVSQFAQSLRKGVDLLISRLAPRADAEAWLTAEKRAGRYSPLPGRKKLRLSESTVSRVRYITRGVDVLVVGYSEFGLTDVGDCLHLIARVHAAAHAEENHIEAEGLEAVLNRVIALMALLLEADSFET